MCGFNPEIKVRHITSKVRDNYNALSEDSERSPNLKTQPSSPMDLKL